MLHNVEINVWNEECTEILLAYTSVGIDLKLTKLLNNFA